MEENLASRAARAEAVAGSRNAPRLHASAVCGPGGVVGFCAASGVGKSTLAAALVRPGIELWSDDALAFEIRDGRPYALPEEPGGRPIPLVALCRLERAREMPDDPEPVRLPAAAAFPELLAYAVAVDPDDERALRPVLNVYLELCRTTPVFRLRFRPDLHALPGLTDHWVHRLPGLRGSLRKTCFDP